MTKKILAVVGATGAQGGGLVRAIAAHQDSGFVARALTRKPESDGAAALQKLGAEVVPADLDDPKSLERAFAGAHGAFCVTNFWEHFSPEREQAQARNLAAAVKAARLQHLIWSTLEDTRKKVPLGDARMPTLMGKYKVPHFDAKGEMDAVFAASGVPTTMLLTSFYWDNLIGFGMGPKQGADGRWTFALPMGDKKLPGIAVEDIGRCAFGIFRNAKQYAGKTVGVAGEHLTGEQMAAALGEALRRPVAYQAVPFEVYRKLGFPGAEDLGNMFQYKHDFEREFCAARDPKVARALNPQLQTFAEWLRQHAAKIPLG